MDAGWGALVGPIMNTLTAIAVVVVGIIVARRKEVMDKIDKKIDTLSVSVDEGKRECRTDIRAVLAQQAAFQYEVAQEYPNQNDLIEIKHGIAELKQELKADIRELRVLSHGDPHSSRAD